ncbi:hypothetical protein ACFVZC_15390 [Streptomyces marokkonensis]|uniref:Secreted protein n=1 Tax=Streptomyces marokkonensis TaxID=324855 RepID=A0ABW6Q6U7_9ACTN
MRRTARALSLAAVAGTVLGALAPAASAGTAPGGGPSWGTASHAPCPEPGGHGWEGHTPGSTAPGAARPEAVEPETLGKEALEQETLEEEALEPETLGEPAPGRPAPDAAVPDAAGIPAPEPGEPGEEYAPAASRTAVPGKAGPRTPEPRATASQGTHCAGTPAPQGVHAGEGGAFTDSVPALAAGGLLIAGAFGAAAHRLYRDRTNRTEA